MKKSTWTISVVTLLGCGIMSLTDGVLQPGYLIKSLVKLIFFLGLPLLLSRHLQLSLGRVFRPHPKALCIGGVLGLVTFGVILLAYTLLHHYIDLSAVPGALEQGAGVTANNFLFVSTYIALCNSMLEEFFFRGFAFLGLAESAGKPFSYLFSAGAFAIYHAGMLISMLPPPLFLPALIALFLCGLLFNYLNSLHGRIWVSWLVHMGANLAINAIGMLLLGML